MTRQEFMKELEFLLCGISEGEREEALQYYNDYFDDAGADREAEVIAALGTPAAVAEQIRRELNDGKTQQCTATAEDRAVIEYGSAGEEADLLRPIETKKEVLRESTEDARDSSVYDASQSYGSSSGRAGKPGQPGRTVIGTMLIIFALLVLSPILLGLGCGVIGILIGVFAVWFALAVAGGAIALTMFLTFLLCLFVGVLCVFVDPAVGIGVIGAGFLCGAIGLLSLMFTVGFSGVATPALLRGIGRLFGRKKRKGVSEQ